METPPATEWVAWTRVESLGPDAVRVFTADRFRAHEDDDFAGLAVDHPAQRSVMIGVSARNRQVEAKATGLAAACDVEFTDIRVELVEV